jgi:predicted dehydrogenase/threonine dehydrogenase-like Zn-dependent dehydrogenase
VKVVVQSVGSGALRVDDVPMPTISSTQVLVAVHRSVLSSGTERAVRSLARSGLVAKARARPDLVREVAQRARRNGIGPTVRAVRERLDGEMTLGYSAVGTVVAVGEHVVGVRVGMRVATAGAGHAEYQAVSGMYTVPVPDVVSDETAAFGALGAIALQGLRQADVGPGSRIVVVGLGLVGRVTARLAHASGLLVAGIDVDPLTVADVTERVAVSGIDLALVENGDATARAIAEWTRGRGADAVLVTAASSGSEPVRRAVEVLRDRGVVVIVGDVGLALDRAPLFEKELTLRLARSYGPGRYDAAYESWGIDYPVGQVRWTAGRNIEAFLDLAASHWIDLADLVTASFPIDEAASAYAALDGRCVSVQLCYPAAVSPTRAVGDPSVLSVSTGSAVSSGQVVSPSRSHVGFRFVPSGRSIGIGLVGAGAFARSTLVPGLVAAGFDRLVAVGSRSGVDATALAARNGFEHVMEPTAVVEHGDVDLVVIATSHESHASLVVDALRAGKHVFCEKPLALTHDELDAVRAAWAEHPDAVLAVGFNRRWSPAIERAVSTLADTSGPLVLNYRVNAGRLAPKHWYHDRRQGGRLIGEACHFVDTISAVVGSRAVHWSSAGDRSDETLLRENFSMLLGYGDGSSATIGYANDGSPAAPKERLEILGRGHAIVVDDFRSLTVDGRTVWRGQTDKGHNRQFVELYSALRGRPSPALRDLLDRRAVLETSAIVIDAAS